ncbi:hypothetical protein [Microcoleus sp. K4-C2]|uniref:hypothetical protein n=1 Tax=Microcoleus sp. K4-C2 TaxID=2818792 RepID=UPI002FD11C54
MALKSLNLSCYASKFNKETRSPARSRQDARPTRIVEKLTVKLDAQQLMTGDRADASPAIENIQTTV